MIKAVRERIPALTLIERENFSFDGIEREAEFQL